MITYLKRLLRCVVEIKAKLIILFRIKVFIHINMTRFRYKNIMDKHQHHIRHTMTFHSRFFERAAREKASLKVLGPYIKFCVL